MRKMYTVRPSGSRAAAHPRPPREQTTSGRPFPANPRRYNITKRVEQIFFHKSGLSLRGAAQQTANGTTHRRHAIPRRHNVTKPVEQAFSRINQHRLCRDRSPDLSARQNIPSRVHPPGDVLPHEREKQRRRTAPSTKIRLTVAGRTGERPLHYMELHQPLNRPFRRVNPAYPLPRRPAQRRR